MKLIKTNRAPGLALILAIASLLSCKPAGSAPPPGAEEATGHIAGKDRFPVRTVPAVSKAFRLRTFSNGQLATSVHTEIKTDIGGALLSHPTGEGVMVKRGALLAQLDSTPVQLRLEQARLTLEEAENSKNDLLVMQGGQWGVDSSISAQQLQNILLQSGYKKALQAIRQLEYELAQTTITAPFAGIVSGVKVARYQHLGAGETICTLIDPYSFEAVFPLLEKEALRVELGQRVKVQPLALPEQELLATVSSINPVVDENGLVRLHAKIRREDLQRYRNQLLEGMNVRVIIEKSIPGQLVIPKSAVVLRSGKPVVFTYDKPSGLAKWNYVTVTYENDTEAAIGKGLKAADLVIYEGNLNLDHDAAVTIEN